MQEELKYATELLIGGLGIICVLFAAGYVAVRLMAWGFAFLTVPRYRFHFEDREETYRED